MQYVYAGRIQSKIPQKWTFKNGTRKNFKTGNFADMDLADHIEEGWLPITKVTNDSFDHRYETRSRPVIAEFAEHAEVTYTITPIDLTVCRVAKRNELKGQGRELMYAKYDLEARERVFAGQDSNAQYKADLTTLKNHWLVIKQAILDADTGQAISAINTSEGSGLEWPDI